MHTHIHTGHVRSTGADQEARLAPKNGAQLLLDDAADLHVTAQLVSAQPVLAPGLLPAGSFFGSGLGFFSLRGLLSGLLSPQGLQLFFSLSQNSSLHLRTCPSSRLGVALALWCDDPAHFCASCAEPLLTGSQSLTWTSDTSPLASSAAAAFRSSSAFLAAAAFAAALSAALAARAFARLTGAFSSSSAASFSAALRAAVAACDKRVLLTPLVSAMQGGRPSPLAESPRPQSASRTCQRRLARSRR